LLPLFFKFWYRFLIFWFRFFVVVFLFFCFHFNRKLPSEKYSKTLWSKTLFCRRWGKTFTGKIGWTSLLQFYVEIVIFYPKSSLLSSFFHGKRTFLLFGFSTRTMSEKYSSKRVKFYTSWLFTSSCNWTFLLTFRNIF
jgi:hypothetical protein